MLKMILPRFTQRELRGIRASCRSVRMTTSVPWIDMMLPTGFPASSTIVRPTAISVDDCLGARSDSAASEGLADKQKVAASADQTNFMLPVFMTAIWAISGTATNA